MSLELTNSQKKRFQILLTRAIDDELSSEERSEFDAFLEKYPECEREWREQNQLKEVTKTMKFKSPAPEVWDRYWVNVYNRLERGIAWILFSIGFVILLTYGGFKAIEALLADTQVAAVVKAGLILALAGLTILLVSVVREKLFMFKRDPYKEVKR